MDFTPKPLATAPKAESASDAKSSTEESTKDHSYSDLLPPMEHESVESGLAKPLAVLRHRSINAFTVGEFKFKNHILYLYSQDEIVRFQQAFKGLDPIDRNAIVTVNVSAISETAFESAQNGVVKGALHTGSIKDPKSIQ